jgi:hypothetical protein
MSVNSYELKKGVQTACDHCGQPFPIIHDLIQCWRSSGGRFFCKEFCADDAEEAVFQSRTQKPRMEGRGR